ncbi:uncharacterized protein DS421_7g213600 [Arachis hypogaea]|nr:uncharacterized protein DS421_7g213600 [Arachis hypogaea]
MLRLRVCEGAKAKERKSAITGWPSGELLRASVVCAVTPCPCHRRNCALVPSREAATTVGIANCGGSHRFCRRHHVSSPLLPPEKATATNARNRTRRGRQ